MKIENGASMNLNDTLNPLLLAYVADMTQSNYFILIPFKKGTPFILVQPVVSDNMQAKEAKLSAAYSLRPFNQATATSAQVRLCIAWPPEQSWACLYEALRHGICGI